MTLASALPARNVPPAVTAAPAAVQRSVRRSRRGARPQRTRSRGRRRAPRIGIRPLGDDRVPRDPVDRGQRDLRLESGCGHADRAALRRRAGGESVEARPRRARPVSALVQPSGRGAAPTGWPAASTSGGPARRSRRRARRPRQADDQPGWGPDGASLSKNKPSATGRSTPSEGALGRSGAVAQRARDQRRRAARVHRHPVGRAERSQRAAISARDTPIELPAGGRRRRSTAPCRREAARPRSAAHAPPRSPNAARRHRRPACRQEQDQRPAAGRRLDPGRTRVVSARPSPYRRERTGGRDRRAARERHRRRPRIQRPPGEWGHAVRPGLDRGRAARA